MKLSETVDIQRKRITELEDILNKIPVAISITQAETIDNKLVCKDIWSNKHVEKFVGYTLEEIEEMGASYFETIIHPDDVELTEKAINLLTNKEKKEVYTGMYRVKHKDEDYRWCMTYACVHKLKPESNQMEFLKITFDTTKPQNTERQLSDALKEISRLENALKLKSLSSRELEILALIAQGKTDEEISDRLFLSKKTVHKHRSNMLSKTECSNTATLVAFAVKSGVW